MIRATTVVRRRDRGSEAAAGALTLDHEGRHRRRVAMRTDDGGLAFLLDLEHAAVLEEGDALRLEDGRLVEVRAAREGLIEIRADTALRLKQLIWHIGNRHVAAEITEDAVYIAHDHVLAEMVRGLGGTATAVERPFRPERGAYGGGHGSASHSHSQDALSHGNDDQGHGHTHGHTHEHGPHG